jgi:class 3 adenylate cyclase/CHASE3 domain sensor protein
VSNPQVDDQPARTEPAADAEAPADPDVAPPERGDPDRLPPLIRPFVDWIAKIRATVHTKLLAGFLVIAVLMLGMGVMSIFVIGRMNDQAHQLVRLQRLSDLSRQGIYDVTAQSHYRAMALITKVGSYNDKIVLAKQDFSARLDDIEAIGEPGVQDVVDQLREIDQRYDAASAQVLALYNAGDLDAALDLHISAEHEISHELEDTLNALIATTEERIAQASTELANLHHFLLTGVVILSGISLLIALGLGAVLSWSVIRPVRKVDLALERIAGGDFEEHVEVPNRDEFGRLTANLNKTTGRLAALYGELTTLNENLEQQVEDQLTQIRRAEQLRRYLAPQVADAVMSGAAPVTLESTRRNLTILYANIRGFTAMSERVEPEELIDALNEYFGVMTDVVFRHGGTLDKYVGDGILSFFGDPIPFEDHAERAVAAALEMRSQLRGIRSKWHERLHEELNVGIGISTGYVTVGNIGSDTRTEYTVIGNHVNLASGLAETAGANQILVSERTLAAVRGRVEAEPVESLTLEDVHRQVKIFEILRADFTAPASPPRVF